MRSQKSLLSSSEAPRRMALSSVLEARRSPGRKTLRIGSTRKITYTHMRRGVWSIRIRGRIHWFTLRGDYSRSHGRSYMLRMM